MYHNYCNVPKFSDSKGWANSVDPEQSDLGLHCLLFRLYILDSLFNGRATLLKFEDNYSNFSVSENLGILRYMTLYHCSISSFQNHQKSGQTIRLFAILLPFCLHLWDTLSHKTTLFKLGIR